MKTSLTISVELAAKVDAVDVAKHPAFQDAENSWRWQYRAPTRSMKVERLLDFAIAKKSTPVIVKKAKAKR